MGVHEVADVYDKHLNCFRQNYPDDKSTADWLETISLEIKKLRIDKGQFVSPVNIKPGQTFGNRAELNRKLKETLQRAHADMDRVERHRHNEDSDGELGTFPLET